MDTPPRNKNCESHICAIDVILAYDNRPSKADEILSAHSHLIPKYKGFSRICQFIFLTLLRNKTLIDALLKEFSKKPPRKKLRALMEAAAADLISAPKDRAPKVADSWVETAKKLCSKSEANYVNAFLRAFPKLRKKIELLDGSPKSLSVKFSHPEWLIRRWFEQFGPEKTLQILEISQVPSKVFFRRSPAKDAGTLLEKFDDDLQACSQDGFYSMKPGCWQEVSQLLKTPFFYVQDPSTSLSPSMLAPKVGESYLDLCAAPGGKSRMIADLVLKEFLKTGNSHASSQNSQKLATLVSVDTGKNRMQAMLENFSQIDFIDFHPVDCDILSSNLPAHLKNNCLPTEFDGVLLDAPCSNTGVLRRRPDARWRLSEQDIKISSKKQSALLEKAAAFVKDGGRLVYSTCSIDFEENEQVVRGFLEKHKEFSLVEGKTFLPSENSDGCGAFLMKKAPSESR